MTPNKLPPLPELSYRKKPVVIEAVQWDGRQLAVVPKWLSEAINKQPMEVGGVFRVGNDIHVFTMEGTTIASPGDWIIRGIKGELYACKPDIFAATYEPAEALRQSQSLPAGAVAGLVGKWRSAGDICDRHETDAGYAFQQCADELEEALQAEYNWEEDCKNAESALEAMTDAFNNVCDELKALQADAREKGEAGKVVVDRQWLAGLAWDAEWPYGHQHAETALDGIRDAIDKRLAQEDATQPAQASEPRKEWKAGKVYASSREVFVGTGQIATNPQPVTPAGGEVEPVAEVSYSLDGGPAICSVYWDRLKYGDKLYTHPPVADAALVRDAVTSALNKEIASWKCAEKRDRDIATLALMSFKGKYDAALNQRGGGV